MSNTNIPYAGIKVRANQTLGNQSNHTSYGMASPYDGGMWAGTSAAGLGDYATASLMQFPRTLETIVYNPLPGLGLGLSSFVEYNLAQRLRMMGWLGGADSISRHLWRGFQQYFNDLWFGRVAPM